MRDRLIEIIGKELLDYASWSTEMALAGHYNMPSVEEVIANKILSDGWMRPPCKVGDTVYIAYRKKVISGEVRLIRPFISEKETIFKGNIICEVDDIFLGDGSKEEIELYVVFEKPYGIERIAYLTKEEAERVLKGGVQG